MDPTACLHEWAYAMTLWAQDRNPDDKATANERYNDLRVWLERGGFEPDWTPAVRAEFFTYSPRTGKVTPAIINR